MIVNSSQGGGFKDTWVLAPDKPKNSQQQGGVSAADAASLIADPQPHTLSLVTVSKADNLYWLGRYTERAFTTLARFFPFYDRVMDTDVDAFRPFAEALDLPQDFGDFDDFIHSFLYDGQDPNSVRSAVVRAFDNAVILRPELSSGLLQYIELAVSNITAAATRFASAEDIYKQRDIEDNMLAFWGGVEDSGMDTTLKASIFIGKYIERIDLYTRLHLAPEELSAPLTKLETYAHTLDGLPLPQCFAIGVGWLSEQLPARGYAQLAERLNEFRSDFDSRSVLVQSEDGTLSAMNMDSRRP
jgi:hypothetical protein